jgi:prevent-host-death family protein
MAPKQISASELKTHCSSVLEALERERTPVTITRRGRPIARLVPVEEEPRTLFGFARGTVSIHGDIVAPLDVAWEAQE